MVLTDQENELGFIESKEHQPLYTSQNYPIQRLHQLSDVLLNCLAFHIIASNRFNLLGTQMANTFLTITIWVPFLRMEVLNWRLDQCCLRLDVS